MQIMKLTTEAEQIGSAGRISELADRPQGAADRRLERDGKTSSPGETWPRRTHPPRTTWVLGEGREEDIQSHGRKLPRTMENGNLYIQEARGLQAARARADAQTARKRARRRRDLQGSEKNQN